MHMACIFSVSSETTRALLHTYPEAARLPCFLSDILTLIGDDSFPLELLERERTVGAPVTPSPRGSDSASEVPTSSDLLFAFHPNIQPFCSDPSRLARIEFMAKVAPRDL